MFLKVTAHKSKKVLSNGITPVRLSGIQGLAALTACASESPSDQHKAEGEHGVHLAWKAVQVRHLYSVQTKP